MTEDKRRKMELCFDSVEKLVSLRRSLTQANDYVNYMIFDCVETLEMEQSELSASDNLMENEIKLTDENVEYINDSYQKALWQTMQYVLPHYKTTK